MTDTLTLQELLARFLPFRGLDSDRLAWLAQRSRPFVCPVGNELLVPDRMPDHCFCVVEGKGRLLHEDPGLRRPVTLALSKPGDLVGWSGLVRRSPCEWLTASTNLKLIGFSAETFYELERDSESFAQWLDGNDSPSELIDCLSLALRKRPHAEPMEREVLRRLLPGLKVIPARNLRRLPDDEAIWLWNSQPSGQQVEIGKEVDADLLASIPPGEPLRLLRVDEKLWKIELNPSLEAPPKLLEKGVVDLWSQDRYSDLAVPPPEGEQVAMNNGENDNAVSGAQETRKSFRGRTIPVVTGVGAQQQALACLEMLARYYNASFRRDILERACRDHIGDHVVSLQTLGNLSTLMGFTGTLTNIEEAHFSRLPFPCFALVEDQPAMLYDISKGKVRAVLPEYGMVRLDVNTLTQGQKGASILTLTPGRETQHRKLGFSWFMPQIKHYRRSLLEVVLVSLVLQLLNLAQPLVFQQIFDKVIGQQNLDTLYTLGLLLLGVALFQGLLSAVRSYLFSDTTNRMDITLGGEVIQHLFRLPLGYFDKRPVGELQTRIAELGNIRNFLTGSAITLLLDSVFSVIYIGVMFAYSGVLTAVSLGVVPLFLGLTLVASPFIRNQLRKAAIKNAKTQSLLIESLNGIQTIKAQNAENTIRWRWQKSFSDYMAENFRTLLIGVSAGTVGSFLNQLTGLLTLWVGAYLVIKGDLTIGQLIAFRMISGYVVGPLLNLATSWQNFQGVALSIERLSDVVDATTEAELVNLAPGDKERQKGGEVSTFKETDQLPLPQVLGDVCFQGVDFRFSESTPMVVKNVSFKVPAGSFVGIVGRSGSGKSTIMKLLPRLYQLEKGRILIDDFDIAKLQLGSVRAQIGIVPQDSLLFDGSVRDNITLTVPDATSEEMISAARVACAHDFIMELPNGYATRVGERGGSLSGGQRQRLAIARAVLQRPSLLILDEATSALDYLTERQLCLNLKKAFDGSTVFFITHRLTTIRSADTILMMDDGSLVEQGSHKELLELKGRYFALHSQQEADLG